jgi:hypothetical protein
VKLINLTPHPVTVAGITIAPEATPARCGEVTTPEGALTVDEATVPVFAVRLGEVTGLPDEAPDVCYVVSRPVAEAQPWRSDLLIPHLPVRVGSGRVASSDAKRWPAWLADGSRHGAWHTSRAVRNNQLREGEEQWSVRVSGVGAAWPTRWVVTCSS